MHVSCHFVSFRLVSFRFAFTFAFTLTAGVRCILLCALKASSYLLLPFALANAHFIEINSVPTSSQHRSAAFWPWHRLLPRHLPRVLWLLLADFMALRGGRPLRQLRLRLWLLALICCGPYSPGASLWLRTWLEQLKDARSTKAATAAMSFPLPPTDCT